MARGYSSDGGYTLQTASIVDTEDSGLWSKDRSTDIIRGTQGTKRTKNKIDTDER